MQRDHLKPQFRTKPVWFLRLALIFQTLVTIPVVIWNSLTEVLGEAISEWRNLEQMKAEDRKRKASHPGES